MPDHYIISDHGDGWAISVGGVMLMVCARKKAAIRAVQDAITPRETAAGAGSAHHAEPIAEPPDHGERTDPTPR